MGGGRRQRQDKRAAGLRTRGARRVRRGPRPRRACADRRRAGSAPATRASRARPAPRAAPSFRRRRRSRVPRGRCASARRPGHRRSVASHAPRRAASCRRCGGGSSPLVPGRIGRARVRTPPRPRHRSSRDGPAPCARRSPRAPRPEAALAWHERRSTSGAAPHHEAPPRCRGPRGGFAGLLDRPPRLADRALHRSMIEPCGSSRNRSAAHPGAEASGPGLRLAPSLRRARTGRISLCTSLGLSEA